MKGRKTGWDQAMSDLEGLIQCAATEESKTELGKQSKRRSLPKANHGRKQWMVVFHSVPDTCGGILGAAGR